ncbi:SH3 domain-containing protein [uncultured Friedmanniella sp.]|uniref:SH3 domain-containing protein n=1 Tax=uncultured Friedmanniella sp. TaxID=335381 RepID=UPI0035CB2BC0
MRARPRRAARPSTVVRVGRIALPGLALALATTGVVATATGAAEPQAAPAPAPAPVQSTASTLTREQAVSRSDFRQALPATPETEPTTKPEPAAKPDPEAKPKAKAKPTTPSLTVVDHQYTRVDLNVRAKNDTGSKLLTVLDAGSRLSVTATVRGVWRYVSYRGGGAWVKDQYLVDKKPAAVAAGISSAACASGSKVESGLTPDAIRVHRAICARYPSVKAYGGVRADSLPEHPSGRALDAMISDSDTGWDIAKWVRANARQLGVSEVLYAQHIWTVQRSGEGWRTFADRGSATANHDDHVHVTVYGHSGG